MKSCILSIVLNDTFYSRICSHLCLFHKLCMDYWFSSFAHFFWLIVLIALLFSHNVFLDIQDHHNKFSFCHLQMSLYKRYK